MDVMSTEDNIVDNLDIKIKSEQLKKYLVEVLTPRERIIIRTALRVKRQPPPDPERGRTKAEDLSLLCFTH